ncbi:protein FAR1-RELATED SEQUENCE 4-like [Cucumis melo var. makuwa]|uniref:Protein FAR1-RELATED SEQUENCE 4-like n=1 Tax=Cucumis melo var. makuwa TaxID=1194695 RepID=A0A5A7SWK0_CUCMM|nr:protein FAR1-RELATED SEQUENCE 4-like [Cucumis melo var. makuwa]TYK30842.1 protein FAR1-RELATED SEQUENCE 4-like [Cucumis melo var. makuwa]
MTQLNRMHLIPRLFDKLVESNLGTCTALEMDDSGHFKFCFMAFGASIEGWKHCRPIISIDGTFLKFRQSWSTFVIRHSINLEQKMSQSNERPLCNVVFNLSTGQGPYLNRFESRSTPIAIASEVMYRAGISRA